jgi:hypothetical protein
MQPSKTYKNTTCEQKFEKVGASTSKHNYTPEHVFVDPALLDFW